MTEIPDNLKSAMVSYANHSDLIQNNAAIQALHIRREKLYFEISEIEKLIIAHAEEDNEKLQSLSEYITAQVLEVGASVSHAGVTAKHRSGYERITWNNDQMTSLCMKNPALLDLLGSARKVTDVAPGVTISYEPEPVEEAEDVAPF